MPHRRRLLLFVAAVIITVIAPVGTAGAAVKCHGLRATIVQAKYASADLVVRGTAGRDVIVLRHAGTVRAGGGADVICGSSGNDVIDSGAGADIILGGAGHDTITSGSGVDHIYGEGGSDRVSSGAGRDFVVGGAGVDAVPRQFGDVVAGGQYGVSLWLKGDELVQFYDAGMEIGLSRSSGGLPLVATSAAPMMQMGFALGGLGAFFTQQLPLPGMVLTPIAQTPVELGSLVAIDPALMLVVSAGQSSPQTITTANNASQLLTPGMLQLITTDGWQQTWGPIAVAPNASPPNVTQQFFAPSTVSLFPVSAGNPMQVLGERPPGIGTATLSPQHPTATFTWDEAAQSFVGAPS